MAALREALLVIPGKNDLVVTTETVVVVFGRVRGIGVEEIAGFGMANGVLEISRDNMAVLEGFRGPAEELLVTQYRSLFATIGNVKVAVTVNSVKTIKCSAVEVKEPNSPTQGGTDGSSSCLQKKLGTDAKPG
jgi:hypothetical protein